jgi:L-malate glycosyltransferase
LLNAGYNVSVYSLTPELNPGESVQLNGNNLQIFLGPYRKRARKRCIDLFKAERNFLKKAMLVCKPDIIHAHWQYEWAWAAIESKIPTLVTCHDSPVRVLQVQRDLYRVIRLVMAKIVLNKAKCISTVSSYTAQGLSKLTKKIITVIPNFEPDYVFNFYKGLRSIGTSPVIVMMNNGFHGLKNVAMGLEAFVAFQKKIPGAQLHLYGHGHGENEDAHNWCMQKGYNKNIFFKGEVDFHSLIEEISSAHILLHTSLEESCSMAVIEAFALGMPVVGGIHSGGMPCMINDTNGKLVDVGNIKSITNALVELCCPENFSKFSIGARKTAIETYSRESVMRKYLSLYTQILSSN